VGSGVLQSLQVPLLTLNVKDFKDFANFEGLVLLEAP